MNNILSKLLLILSLLLAPLSANSAPIVSDISNYRIEMDTSFNGTRLFLFGARNDAGDVVVVIRGPEQNYIVRKKEKAAGIWINTERMKFYDVPAFYMIATSKPLNELEDKGILALLGIGQNVLLKSNNPTKQLQFNEFSQAFLRHQQVRELYIKDEGKVEFMGETLFKTAIDFPSDIPPGEYTAEIYLISDGQIAGMQSTPIKVAKSGLDATIYNAAHEKPALYGLAAIAVALAAGWLAGRIFQR